MQALYLVEQLLGVHTRSIEVNGHLEKGLYLVS